MTLVGEQIFFCYAVIYIVVRKELSYLHWLTLSIFSPYIYICIWHSLEVLFKRSEILRWQIYGLQTFDRDFLHVYSKYFVFAPTENSNEFKQREYPLKMMGQQKYYTPFRCQSNSQIQIDGGLRWLAGVTTVTSSSLSLTFINCFEISLMQLGFKNYYVKF